MKEDQGLAYVGKIIELREIENSNLLSSAVVVCGKGSKWRGVVKNDQFDLGDLCLVHLPDAVVPKTDDYSFMKARGWRVKMCRFRGAPSEVLIIPLPVDMMSGYTCGTDVTELIGVTKYQKPISIHLQGIAKGHFPDFIPKTDELNYQKYMDLVQALEGCPYYVTEKMDGSSTTAYKYKGGFGICSRNYEVEWNKNNGYCKVAEKYRLRDNLPEGVALQWETCGPGIQKNSAGLTALDGYAFSAYDIVKKEYYNMQQLISLCEYLQFPMCRIIEEGAEFSIYGIESMGEGKYKNGSQREGVVVRSKLNTIDGKPISFKVINLNYGE